MNFRDHNREKAKARVRWTLGFIAIIAVLIMMALLGPGCYSNGTSGRIEFPLTLLPDDMKTDDVRATIEADPTIMVKLKFKSTEHLFGGASIQRSKKDIKIDVQIPGFMSITASGGRSLEEAAVDGSELVEGVGGAVGRAVHEAVGVP